MTSEPLEIKLKEIETRLTEKLDNLIDRFEAVSNGTGFPRCSDRAARLLAVEREVVSLKKHNEKEITRSELDRIEKHVFWLESSIVGLLLIGLFVKMYGGA